jgi:hypothetical protein
MSKGTGYVMFRNVPLEKYIFDFLGNTLKAFLAQ